MRKSYALFALLLATTAISAQNWMPVAPGRTYHYRMADSAYITHTIRVDTVYTWNGDSIYGLNTVVLPYDFDGQIAIFDDQGQFLGQHLRRKADGQFTIHLSNIFLQEDRTLKPWAALGESWPNNPMMPTALTATVTNLVEGTVLGEPDSLKTIQFSDGQQWVLSKNHGIVRAPAMTSAATVQLTGMESATQQLGSDRLYKPEDFFSYQPGDVLEYCSYIYSIGGGVSFYKIEILGAATVSATSISYPVRERRKNVVQYPPPVDTFYNDYVTTLTFGWGNNGGYNYIPSYTNQLVRPNEPDGWYMLPYYTIAQMFPGGIRFGKKPSSPWDDEECSALRSPTINTDDFSASLGGLECTEFVFYDEYRKGIGQVEWEYSVIDINAGGSLKGAYIQGDTVWGELSPDWAFSGNTEPEVAETMHIWPNPARGLAYVTWGEAWSGRPARLRLFDAQGRLAAERSIPALHTDYFPVDLAGISPGIYQLEIQNATRRSTGRLLVQAPH
jgi:hypothetical protein